MRVTANQVTLARLVLLPIPMAMIYRQTTGWMLGALVIFVVLGLTDAVDGMMARRYGSTPLGALLDPIVDKIFLVAAFGPLADLRMVLPWTVTVMFVRELAVTVLRSIALEEDVQFQTSKIAKLKATTQMAGAGFIFLFWMFPNRPAVTVIQVLAMIGCVLPPVIQLLRGKRPGWRAWSGLVLIGGMVPVRSFVGPEQTVQAMMGLIVAITVYSGAEYFWKMRGPLVARFRRIPIDVVRVVALALVVPVGFLPVMQRPGAPIWAILAVLALELAAGGVDNALAQEGWTRPPRGDLARAAGQAVGASGMVAALVAGAPMIVAHAFGAFAVAVTLVEVLGRFWRHRDHFLALSGRV